MYTNIHSYIHMDVFGMYVCIYIYPHDTLYLLGFLKPNLKYSHALQRIILILRNQKYVMIQWNRQYGFMNTEEKFILVTICRQEHSIIFIALLLYFLRKMCFLVVPCASTNIDYQGTESFQFSLQRL